MEDKKVDKWKNEKKKSLKNNGKMRKGQIRKKEKTRGKNIEAEEE